MKRPKVLGLIVAIIGLGASSAFAESADQWRYSRDVSYANKEAVKAIYLDEAVYAYANKDLSDLRLINDQNEFVPYYIYNGFLSSTSQEHISYPSKEILTYKKDHNYYADYEISPRKQKEDIVGNMLEIEVTKDSFYKEIQVLGSYDNKTWETITSDTIYHINGQNKRVVSLGDNYKYLYYRIISKNDIGEVPISYVTLVYDQVASTYDQHKKIKQIDYKAETSKETKETVIKIHNKDKLRISRLQLKSKSDFNREYALYAESEEADGRRKLTNGSIYQFKLGEYQVADMCIPMQETMEVLPRPEYLELIIQNQDDQPIEIDAIHLEYYIDKLVFKTSDPTGVQLLYGNETAQKPHYDISSYRAQMEKSAQEEAKLLDLVTRSPEGAKEKKAINLKLILNIAVVIVSSLLGFVILKKNK